MLFCFFLVLYNFYKPNKHNHNVFTFFTFTFIYIALNEIHRILTILAYCLKKITKSKFCFSTYCIYVKNPQKFPNDAY